MLHFYWKRKNFLAKNQFYKAKESFEKIITLDSSHLFAKEQLVEIEKKIEVLSIRDKKIFDYYERTLLLWTLCILELRIG